MLHAQSKFSSPGVPRLEFQNFGQLMGITRIRPEVKWDEWDQAGWTNDSIIAYPALTALSATWNKKCLGITEKLLEKKLVIEKKDIFYNLV